MFTLSWKFYFAIIVDINECEAATADCDHICINTDGGYNCECEIGYALHDKDRRTCQKGVNLTFLIINCVFNSVSRLINTLIYFQWTMYVIFSRNWTAAMGVGLKRLEIRMKDIVSVHLVSDSI